jgi:ABC-2 type transport system permease protein
MIFTKQLAYDVRGILTDWMLYFALIMSIIPAFGILYSIVNLKGPFDTIQVTYFYTSFGAVLSIIVTIRPFVKDLQNNTIVLFMNRLGNRYKYYTSKLVASVVVGLIFGLVGMAVLSFASYYADLNIPTELYYQMVIHYMLFTLFYGSLFLTLSTFIKSPIGLIVTALLSILLLPSLLQVPLYIDGTPEFILTFVTDYLPLNFAPDVLGSHNFITAHYVSFIVFTVVFAGIGYFKIGRTDY